MAEQANASGVTSKLEEFRKYLDQYRDKFHLNKIKVKEVDLEVTIPELRKMAPEDIAEKMLEWGYYSLAIQKQMNDLAAELTWVESNLKRYLGVHQTEQEGYSAKERELLILKNDNYANGLYDLQRNISSKMAQLNYIPTHINFLIKIGQQIIDNKWKERMKP